MAEIEDFLSDNDEFVAGAAKDIEQIRQDYVSGKINEEMRDELIRDAIELMQVKAAAASLDLKIKLEQLIDIAKLLMSFVK